MIEVNQVIEDYNYGSSSSDIEGYIPLDSFSNGGSSPIAMYLEHEDYIKEEFQYTEFESVWYYLSGLTSKINFRDDTYNERFPVLKVRVFGNTMAFIDSLRSVVLFDISNVASPEYLGMYTVPDAEDGSYVLGGVKDLFVHDTFAYVVWESIWVKSEDRPTYESGMFVVDISPPTRPSFELVNFLPLCNSTSVISLDDHAEDMLLVGCNNNEGVRVVDISSPESPEVVSSLTGFSSTCLSKIHDEDGSKFVFMCDYQNNFVRYLDITDIYDMSNPVNIAQTFIMDVYVDNQNYLYIGRGRLQETDDLNRGLSIYDIRNENFTEPCEIILLNGVSDYTNIHGMEVVEDIMYYRQNDKFRIADFSNRLSPSIISETNTNDRGNLVRIGEEFVAVGDGDTAFKIFNVSDLTSPVLVSEVSKGDNGVIIPGYGSGRKSLGVRATEEGVYFCGDDGFSIMNFASVDKPVIVGSTLQITGILYCKIEVDDVSKRAYVAMTTNNEETSALYVVDVSDKTSPQVLGNVSYYRVMDVELNNSIAYLAVSYSDSVGGVVMVDMETLEVLYEYNDGGETCRSLHIQGDLCVAVCGAMKFFSVNGTGPPEFLTEFSTDSIKTAGGYPLESVTSTGTYQAVISEDQNLLRIVDGYNALRIYDISDIRNENIELIGSYNPLNPECANEGFQRIQIRGDFAFLAGGCDGVRIVDITDNESPNEVSRYFPNFDLLFDIDDYIVDISMVGNLIFLAAYELGYIIISAQMGFTDNGYSWEDLCGESEVTLFGIDYQDDVDTNEASISFTVEKDSFCQNDGICLPGRECGCINDYQGTYCETWSCREDKDDSDVCSGNGECLSPDICDCEDGYEGTYCSYFIGDDDEEDTASNVATPLISSITGLGIIAFVALLFSLLCVCCCCYCFVCCCGVIGVLMIFSWRSSRKLRKFKKLKNIDVLLEEHKMDADSVNYAQINMKKELFKIKMSEVKIIKILGEGGSSSVVYLAEWHGRKIAFKCFKTRTLMSDQDDYNEFEKEVEVFSSISHPNVVSFFGCTLDPPRVGILMEFCEKGECLEYINDYEKVHMKKYPIFERKRMLLEVISAMGYLHARNIVHRDLKPENILLDASESCKLMDFGLSKIGESQNEFQTKRIGTSHFMAPEITIGRGFYDDKCDVFSFGVFMYVLLTGIANPYPDEDVYGIEMRIAADPNFRPNVSEVEKVFLDDGQETEDFQWMIESMKRCWDHEPEKRPPFKELSELYLKEKEKEEQKRLEKEKDRKKNLIDEVDLDIELSPMVDVSGDDGMSKKEKLQARKLLLLAEERELERQIEDFEKDIGDLKKRIVERDEELQLLIETKNKVVSFVDENEKYKDRFQEFL